MLPLFDKTLGKKESTSKGHISVKSQPILRIHDRSESPLYQGRNFDENYIDCFETTVNRGGLGHPCVKRDTGLNFTPSLRDNFTPCPDSPPVFRSTPDNATLRDER